MTTAEGASLVKPSLDFNADVAITSPTIAITRNLIRNVSQHAT